MRTLRLLGASVVVLALLAAQAVAAVAQSEVGRLVTGTMSCGDAGDRFMLEDQTVQLDLWPTQCTLTMSDPRVSGVMSGDLHMACFLYDADRSCLIHGTASLAGPDGTWVGTTGAINDATNMELPGWATMQGTGDYEGWTFWYHNPNFLDESAAVSGIVYEGPPPPWSESLPLMPAE